jgi:hypothetical protein
LDVFALEPKRLVGCWLGWSMKRFLLNELETGMAGKGGWLDELLDDMKAPPAFCMLFPNPGLLLMAGKKDT